MQHVWKRKVCYLPCLVESIKSVQSVFPCVSLSVIQRFHGWCSESKLGVAINLDVNLDELPVKGQCCQFEKRVVFGILLEVTCVKSHDEMTYVI